MMADHRVIIEGTYPTGTAIPTSSYPAVNPIFTGGYVFSQEDIPGVAAANNYLALTNPVGSGKTILVAGVFISSFILADIATTSVSMRGYLATSVSGGVLHSAASIGKVRSTMPNSVGEIRDTNPSATLGAPWFNSPPVIGASKGSSPFVHQIPATIPAGSITLLPGESTVIRQEAGDVDARWNISIAWSEF
jgi:hypothetical protein